MDLSVFNRFVGEVKGSLGFFVPEIVLVVTVLVVILADLLLDRERSWMTVVPAAIGTAIAALFVFPLLGGPDRELFSGMIVIDRFSNFFKLFFLVGTILILGMSALYRNFRDLRMGEYYGIMIGSVLGMFLMASANDFLMFYLSLELVSIASYILVVYLRRTREGAEAGMKYVIYGSVASGLMIYGISLFYGMTGTTSIAGVTNLLAEGTNVYAVAVASLLMLAGFGYKMASFPMHFWCPDVYEGAPTPITAFLSVTSKAAGFAMFIRFLFAVNPFFGEGFVPALGDAIQINWVSLLALLSALTMTFGNLAALFQTNVKRLLAYSSIAHAGYMLMGVTALNWQGFEGFKAVAFYMVVYLFMNLGAFTVVILMKNITGSEKIEDYKGMIRRSPFLAIMLIIFLFALIGMPPTGGFTGKLQLFMAAINQELIWLAVVAAINTAVSVYYYARIIRVMCLEEATDTRPVPVPVFGVILVLVMVIPVLYLGVSFNWLAEQTQNLTVFGIQ
jgi:NADH-quinone oxidoreductase subunit N